MSTKKNRMRPRKSERLTVTEHDAFKKWVRSFHTKHDALLLFPFSRITLDTVLLKGSGKPETCEAIRAIIRPLL